MNHPKQRHGNHTWDMVLYYYRCDKCDYVFESRDKFEHRFKVEVKELNCPRCHARREITRIKKATFGPLLGHDQEVDI